ncbi:MAG: hypothetical protein ACOYJ2_05000 [Rickettsiales bacterium]
MSDTKNKTAAQEREDERQKTQLQKAEDIAYTINHAISCGVTDLGIQPYIYAGVVNHFPSWLQWIKNLMEGHDHPHHHDDHHEPEQKPKTKIKPPGFWKNVGHYLQAEIYGDVGAIPLTIAVQRIFPEFMEDIRKWIEPIAGKTFREGAEKASIKWAQRNGFFEGSEQQKAKAHELYEYEMSHLPQAVMWNAFAWPTNIVLQRYVFKDPHHSHGLAAITTAKTFGAIVSNGMLLTGRAVAPDLAHQWDQWNSKHIIAPVTKVIGSTIGIDHETVDKVAKKQEEMGGHRHFAERLQAEERATTPPLLP